MLRSQTSLRLYGHHSPLSVRRRGLGPLALALLSSSWAELASDKAGGSPSAALASALLSSSWAALASDKWAELASAALASALDSSALASGLASSSLLPSYSLPYCIAGGLPPRFASMVAAF